MRPIADTTATARRAFSHRAEPLEPSGLEAVQRLIGLLGTAHGPVDVWDALARELLDLPGVAEVHLVGAASEHDPATARAYRRPFRPAGAYVLTAGAREMLLPGLLPAGGRAFNGQREGLPPELVTHLPSDRPLLIVGGTARSDPVIAVLVLTQPVDPGSALAATAGALGGVAGVALSAVEEGPRFQRDPRTGCLDPEGLWAALDEEIARNERQGASLTCLVVALDDLALISERYGASLHAQTLRHVGDTLRAELRRLDRVGSLDEGEFVILLSGTGASGAEVTARRLLGRLNAVKLESEGARRPMHVAIGLAERRSQTDGVQLIRAARSVLRGARPAAPIPPGSLDAAPA